MKRNLYSWAGLLVAVVLLVAINVLAANTLRGARVDLTEKKLYTLSEGTRNILQSIEEPIDITFYFSRDLAQANAPSLMTYATRVQELLEEYRDVSGGMIRLEIVDPQPFSEEEDEAALAGLNGVPVNAGGDSLFFGLVATNSIDDTEVIPFFDMRREGFLEYDLSEIIYGLTQTEETVIGVISTLPVFGTEDPMAAVVNPQNAEEPWLFIEQLRQLYTVRNLGTNVSEIEDDVNVLLLIHPKELGEETLYALDQFVLGGGRLIAFVDPIAEADQPEPLPGQNQLSALWQSRASDINRLSRNWGLRLVENRFVGDRERARRISIRNERGVTESIPYVAYQSLQGEEQLSQDDIITATLEIVNVGTPGALEPVEDAGTNVEVLMSSTADSQLIDVDDIRFAPQPRELLSSFEATGEEYIYAARVTGPASTAFAGGIVGDEEEAREGHLEQSEEDINVLMVSDVDMLADRSWVQVQNFFGQRVAVPYASNIALVQNAIENLSGSSDLISVRSRGESARPFVRLQDIAQEAEEKFRERENQLMERIDGLEQQLAELQAARPDAAATTSMFLTPEQEEKIEEFQEERVQARKELRQVRYELNKDIERMATMIKVINIGAIPLVITLFAIILGVIRVSRRRG